MKYLNEYDDNRNKWTSNYIDRICKVYGYIIDGYTINADGSLYVHGSVNLTDKKLKKLPLKFSNVSGSFACSSNELTNLEGCPQNVGSYLSCEDNKLTSFKGAPKTVGGNFWCYHNQLRDIYGIPNVQGSIYINDNPVFSLIGYFITCKNKREEWIELFNELDIIQDDGYTVILDRLKYFYEGTKLNIDVTEKMLDGIRKIGYKII